MYWFKIVALTMVQVQNIKRQEIASVKSPVLNWSEQPLFKATAGLRQGFLSQFFPMPDYIEAIPKQSRIRSMLR